MVAEPAVGRDGGGDGAVAAGAGGGSGEVGADGGHGGGDVDGVDRRPGWRLGAGVSGMLFQPVWKE